MVKTFQKNAVSCVSQAGILSNFFRLERGCRQGDPISPYIFLLCAEILAIKIKNNTNIKGIEINNNTYVISQYADDTVIILDGTENSLRALVKELEEFYTMSGLKINKSKTQLVWIGEKKYSTEKICQEMSFQWTTSFKLLGIQYDVDLGKIISLNYDKKLVKIKGIIEQWKRRNLTPIGKITLIKSLIVSQLNHLFITLPNPNEKTIKQLNDILFNFIWNSKIDKIKRKVITQNYTCGGLKMIDLDQYIKGLKSTWIRRILRDSHSNWKILLESCIDLEILLSVGSDYQFHDQVKQLNNFWKEVINAYHEIQDKTELNNWQEYMCQSLWYNKNIRIDNKPLFYRKWYNKGIKYIYDLLDEDCNFLTLDNIQHRFSLQISHLAYTGIVHAIKSDLKKYNFERNSYRYGPHIPQTIKIYICTKRGSRPMYDILNRVQVTNPTGKRKWAKVFNIPDSEWKFIFTLPFQVCKDSKLQWTQVRINHYILTTNTFMYKIGMINYTVCTLCETEDETIYHLIWQCSKTQQFIGDFKIYCNSKNIAFEIADKTFIFGDLKSQDKVLNYLLIYMKYYIYKTRCLKHKLSVKAFLGELYFSYKTLELLAKEENEINNFNANWEKWTLLWQD